MRLQMKSSTASCLLSVRRSQDGSLGAESVQTRDESLMTGAQVAV